MTIERYYIHQINKSESLLQIFIEMKLADDNLESYLKRTPVLKEGKILDISRQLFAGLKFAHDNKMAHMDIKPENVLILSGVCKISDWGGSLLTEKQSIHISKIGNQGKIIFIYMMCIHLLC
jgi:serine/threonine protein kinase